MTAPEGTWVGQLRIDGAWEDSPALRTAVGGAVAAAELEPPGLPPAAILIVRRMADPLPGRLSGWRSRGADLAWERAGRRALQDVWGRAARPARGAIPPDAEAVLFADEAELLACLAADLLRGAVAERWWWARVAPLLTMRLDLAAVLGSRPEAVPGILSLLRQWDLAVQVVAGLSGEAARALLQAVLAAYGSPAASPLAGDLADWAAPGTAQAGAPAGGEPAGTPPVTGRAGPRPPAPPPPLVELPAATSQLGPEQAVLLAVALTLRERPAVAGSPGFRRAVRRWWAERVGLAAAAGRDQGPGPAGRGGAAVARAEMGGAPAGGRDPAVAAGPAPAGAGAARATAAGGRSAGPARAAPPRRAGAQAGPSGAAVAPAEAGGAPGGGRDPAVAAGPAPAGAGAARATAAGGRSAGPARAAPPRRAGAVPGPGRQARTRPGAPAGGQAAAWCPPAPEGAPMADGVDTALAGVLYLVNVMHRLGLPACLEAAWPPGVELGAWGLLDAVARGLLAGGVGERRPRELAADPLWSALVELAGRDPGSPLGGDCRGLHDHGLPSSWEGSDGQARAWRFRGPLAAPVGGCQRRWLALAVPFLRRWLARSLGMGVGKVAGELLRPGRVHVTTTHVDAVMSLDAISLPVRVAGLDADPGWVPELGRVVQFHFE